jgi:hypothetical protein
LNRYFGEAKSAQMLNNNGTQLLNCQPTSHQALWAAQHLMNCDLTEATNRLLMQAQAVSLLAFELSQQGHGLHQTPKEFNQKYATFAKLARDILYKEFKNPSSKNSYQNEWEPIDAN